jgi:predicted GIY-YIG superfamily endonuclease
VSRSVVYTLHLWPPLKHARHYTGSSRKLPERLTDHALGRGARMLQVQLERGGFWVVAQTEPGGVARERQLKNWNGAGKRCQVCKAIDRYRSGELSKEEALSRAGWDRASEFERGLLLDMFGIDQAPEPSAEQLPEAPEPRRAPEPQVQEHITPEVDTLVDALIEGWSQEPQAEPELDSTAQLPEVPAPRRAPEPQVQEDITPEVSAQIEGWSQEAQAEPELEIA